MAEDIFDYIVVGAGSAGCVLAGRLSEDGKSRILLLEAGGTDRRPWIRVPIGYAKSYIDPSVNWRYESEPEPGLLGRASYWPRGKVLGGSSSINAMVYCRGVPGDYDDWRDAGNPGWGWSDIEAIYHGFERRILPDGTGVGDGPLYVSDREPEYHPLKRHFYAAAQEIGYRVVDLNGADPDGVGAYAITTRRGLRCSASDAFLRPAMSRPNLVVRTGAFVERIAFEGRRAIGVVCRAGRESRTYRCRREVIVAGGAVNSPKLLQLSGIGPGALLASLGIPVVHGNDSVGGGLQDHLGVNYYYAATEPTLNAVLGTRTGQVRAALQFLLWQSGPLSLSVNQMGGLVRSTPAKARPDMQLYFNPLSYLTDGIKPRKLLKPDKFPGFIFGFNPCRPTSRGRIDIASPEPEAPPRIMPNSLSTDHDLADVLGGAHLIARFQRTAGLRRLIERPTRFDPAQATDDEIIADFRARSGTVYHPCGTCRMAPEANGGVVGPDLRVHGVEGLRVADASIFPNITSANTNAPTILVAHKAALAILAQRRTSP